MSSPIAAAGGDIDENEPLIQKVQQGLNKYQKQVPDFYGEIRDLATDDATSLKSKIPAVREVMLNLNEWLQWFYQAQESLLRAKAGASLDGEDVMEKLSNITYETEKAVTDLKGLEAEMSL